VEGVDAPSYSARRCGGTAVIVLQLQTGGGSTGRSNLCGRRPSGAETAAPVPRPQDATGTLEVRFRSDLHATAQALRRMRDRRRRRRVARHRVRLREREGCPARLVLQSIEDEDVGDDIALSFVNLVALVPLLGNIVDFAQMIADDSFEEPWAKGNTSQDKLWGAAVSHLAGWDAPWIARNDAAKLVRAARGLEYVTDTALQVVVVGHTHRPGIAWANIAGERSIPIVDVGSWTYGRAEIAIVTPNGVGLAAIPNV
jgi:hypothetical protein